MLNDPTILGWLTTGMYLAAAWLCAAAAASPRFHRRDRDRRIRLFWSALAAILFLLAVNKQLDIQTALIDVLRDRAEREGWYGRRRAFQMMFAAFAIAFMVACVWALKRTLGGRWREHWLVVCGVGLLACFIVLRVADIQRLGEMTGLPVSAEGARSIIEWLGLAAIAVAAWQNACATRMKPL